MTKDEALQLQLWVLQNLDVDRVTKENQSGSWIVTIGVNGVNTVITDVGDELPVVVVYDPQSASPRLAFLALRGEFRFKVMIPQLWLPLWVSIPVRGLQITNKPPILYDGLTKHVLVF